jgi:hypothetical protein
MSRPGILLASALWLLGAACGRTGGEAAEAREVLQRYLAASRSSDWRTVYELAAGESRPGSLESFVREQETTPDFVKAATARMQHEVLAVRVNGDRAEADVRVQVPGRSAGDPPSMGLPNPAQIEAAPLQEIQRTFQLVREPSGWKVVFPTPQPARRTLPEGLREAVEQANP